jgi:hypothetical protein
LTFDKNFVMQKISSSNQISTLRATAPSFTYSSNDLFMIITKIIYLFNLVATEDLTHMNKYTLSTVNSNEYKFLIYEYLIIFYF